MRVSYRWIRELVPGLEASPSEVAERLTRAGLEVEAIDSFGAGLERVIVAEVRKIEPHPNRDRLRLVTVDTGAGEQRVVCGASNVPDPGGRVPLARVGTTLPAVGLTLDAREIGGVASEGMICSESEMGLGEDSDGILVLAPEVGALGQPLTEALPASDTIYDVGVTPNRPDALGHVGVARDVAALFGLEVSLPGAGSPPEADARLDDLISVSIEDGERCPLYGAGAVLDVRIGPSPHWLRWRLHALGVRPISNVVDVTNLLLLEFGQPMHAFDLDLVRQARIEVRRARAGEVLRTLDGEDRKLVEDDLVICDGEGPTALAGVMGGETSEIRDSTTRVLLECAYFTPRGIRRTARRHGMQTESSYRFERGVDWGAVPRVLDRAKQLLGELAGGRAVPGTTMATGTPLEVPTLTLRSERLDALLGVDVPFDDACAALERLGLAVESRDGGSARVRGASWRPDIEREVDLIEEVARVRGLDSIPTVLPSTAPMPPRTTGKLERTAAETAVALGFSEAVTYSFVSPSELDAVRAPKPLVRLTHPLTEERSVLRTSLLPGLLEATRRARRRGERDLRLFTVGSTFLARTDSPSDPALKARPELAGDAGRLPRERPCLAVVLAGARPAYLQKPADVDVYDAKGLGVALVERLTGRAPSTRRTTDGVEHLHPRGSGELLLGQARVGVFGPLHPDCVDALDLDGSVMVVEIDLVAIEALGTRRVVFQPIPKLPAVTRDVALVVSDDVSSEDVRLAIGEAAGDLCESVDLFDLFRGGSVPEDHRSLAFRVVYRDPKAATHPDAARTLTDKEVDQRHTAVVKAVNERFGATLRA